MPDSPEIQSVIREEIRRGRQGAKLDEKRIRRRKDLMRLLKIRRMEDFEDAMRRALLASGEEPSEAVMSGARAAWRLARKP